MFTIIYVLDVNKSDKRKLLPFKHKIFVGYTYGPIKEGLNLKRADKSGSDESVPCVQ